jgi:putative ABC transport system substrate-binding protein
VPAGGDTLPPLASVHSGRQADMIELKRRQFISALSGAAAWPFAARAQQRAMPVVGFLSGGSSAGFAPLVTAFRQGLREVGFVEGQNVVIEFRWAAGRCDRLPALPAELAGRRVAVIAATGGAYERDLGGKTAIGEIPRVFLTAGDPAACATGLLGWWLGDQTT